MSKNKGLWIALGIVVILVIAFQTARIIVSQPADPKVSEAVSAVQESGYQIIRMNVVLTGWQPDSFRLKKDIPVKWIIYGKEITSCNHAIDVPALNLYFQIHEGEQTIEFTPHEKGVIEWSCWMGMIDGIFVIEE